MNENVKLCDFYANEDKRNEPKEAFKMILNKMVERKNIKGVKSIVDIGCATGDFLYFLKEKLQTIYPDLNLYGIDIFPDLLEIARNRMPDVEFLIGDVFSGKDMPANKRFDVICMSGVNCLFKEFKPWINNIINIWNKDGGGGIYIFGVFNSYGFDVSMDFKKTNELEMNKSYTIFSVQTISNYLESLNVKFKFYPFEIDIDISQNKEDFIRSWTVNLESGKRGVLNGLQLWHEFYLLEITQI